MRAFTTHTGLAVPLDRANIDTDQIIPKQFLKRIERSGFGAFLFHDWRHSPDGALDLSFELNQSRYEGATVLLAAKNFGCGSSREHAPWALADWGFRAIIAPSFADIFANNCIKNGLLPIVLNESDVMELMQKARDHDGYQITVDLEETLVKDSFGFASRFAIDEFARHCLLHGLDDISLTLQHEQKIREFEQKRPAWKAFQAI